MVTGQTMAGTFTSNQALTCNNVSFPEFFRSRSFESIGARIFFSECRYDVIFGRDLISQMGLILDFKDGYMEWDGQNVVMRAFPDPPSTGPNGISDPPIASQMFSEMLEEELSAHDDSYNGSDGDPDDLPDLCPRTPHITESFQVSEPQGSGYKTKRQEIKKSKYESADLPEVVKNCGHLTQRKRLTYWQFYPNIISSLVVA